MASMSSRTYTLEILFIHILMASAWSHKEYEMSSDQVCSRMGRRELPITFEHPALVRDGGRLFSDWPGIRRYDCRWKVEGKRDGKGVTAVVQKVRLRKASEKDCVDYIQFKRESRVDKGPRICGSVLFGVLLDQNDTFPSLAPYSDSVALSEATDHKSDWVSLAAYGSIIDVEGEVMTYVHVAQKKIQLGEKIEMVVAYTAFQECREKVPEGSFHCGYGLCISSSLVKDGVINCPFSDCIDEGSCHEARDSNVTRQILSKSMLERGSGSDPTSSSFAALFILVVICLAIYYLYRRYRKSRQLPGEVYGSVNGTAQQQAITGTGYIEIPGSASNQPYNSDSMTHSGLNFPYPLDPMQLQSITVSPYPLGPPSPLPQHPLHHQHHPVMVFPATVPAQQQPNPTNKTEDGTSPPPIGFVIAEISVQPPSRKPQTPPVTREMPKPPVSEETEPPAPEEMPPDSEEMPLVSREKPPTPPVSREKPPTPPVSREKPPTPPASRDKPQTPPVSREKPPTPPVSREKPPTPPVSREKPPTPPVSRETPPASRETSPQPPLTAETPPVTRKMPPQPPVSVQMPPVTRKTSLQPPPPPPRLPPKTEMVQPSAPPPDDEDP